MTLAAGKEAAELLMTGKKKLRPEVGRQLWIIKKISPGIQRPWCGENIRL